MKYVIPFFLALTLWSCEAKKTVIKDKIEAKVCQPAKANTTVELGVKGMVCQMGCGGSIRKALKETCAVDRVEVNYIDSLEEQTIKVYYDRQKIAPKQMIGVLSKINDNQFAVRSVGIPQSIK
jgi:copper chaperone CopZ